MSDQPGTESFEDDLGSISIDDATDAGSAQDELLDSSEGDNEPWSPPDSQPRNTEWGTTAAEQAQEESIEQRIRQEEPDPDSAYGAPDNESGLDADPRVGGDDPDSIDAADDFLGDAEVGAARAGSLTDPDEGAREDVDSEMVGEESSDSPGDGGGLSAEEQAMHIVED
ncbi:hypothetical protein SAMN04489867_3694 [Pedococcus dokdonensis]|uniref:DUF5709 domain-containing protein n=1 Tax=Pedococcus dokdonensis TaxID=443156 RepID=A0A1H0V6U0_9MICO|nr:DUF5709 domain-containing protein [Pedococcus dokdonensis]SDP73975.1 hypothetical protein SAMN04489867_3694 [Pedococcus dokdonensis]